VRADAPDGADEILRLPDGTSAQADGEGRLVLGRGPRRFAIGPLRPDVIDSVRSLAGTGATGKELLARAGDGASPAALELGHVLTRLHARGWLERKLRFAGAPLATLRPKTNGAVGVAPVDPGARLTMSRFAFLHRSGDELVVESPRSTAVVALHEPRLALLIAALTRPRRAEDLGTTGLPPTAVAAVLHLLAEAGVLVAEAADGAGGGGGDEEEAGQALAQWGFADLVFHAASRFGRQDGGYGATFPLEGRFDPLPARKPVPGRPVPLTRPDLDEIAAADPPFTAVLERRRSIREHDDTAPITLRQLGDFLYRSAAVRGPEGRSAGEGPARPYPSGGALYELELYPVVSRCDGLEAGLYHYDPVDHRLGFVTGHGPAVQRLVDDARARSLMAAAPQVLVVVAARFGRVMFKYEAMAYAAILKNVGALYQTMYCVGTAMGLAPCALGGGNADAFALAAGLDYYAESSVGEFLVGSVAGGGRSAEA
jgi:SagB-type dehydrogenase family enzyme